MLEEAIEYLKTLQVQVQMMSMGTGLCMPPAMLLPAMHQHLQALHHHPMAHAHAHFPQLGMGLGFSMGAAAAGFDMLPRVAAGAHFPCTPMAMPPPGAMFGVPGQGMPSLPAAFAHMAGTAPAGQMQAGAGAAAAAPARPGEAEHPPGRGVAQVQCCCCSHQSCPAAATRCLVSSATDEITIVSLCAPSITGRSGGPTAPEADVNEGEGDEAAG